MNVDTRNLLLCVLGTLGAMLVAWPFAEGGYTDDFSYIHMAKTLAETGRFAYNGWPTAMLGIQVWWGAAWIWLFGFSFTLVRLSVWPLALGAVALVYLLARRARLSADDSLFVALMTGLCPTFVVLAPTFMSDIPALFFLVGCLYAFARAVEAAGQNGDCLPPAWVRWMVIGLLSGVLGGTIRQAVWFAPLAGSVALIFWPGVRPVVRLVAVASSVAMLACIVFGMRWFNGQPYAIPMRTSSFATLVSPSHLLTTIWTAAYVFVGVMKAILPVLARRFSDWRQWRRDQCAWLGRSCVVDFIIVGASMVIVFYSDWRNALLASGNSMHGSAATDLCRVMLKGVMMVSLALLACTAMFVIHRHRVVMVSAAQRLPPALVVPLAFLMLYSVALLRVSNTTGGLFDRYYLPHVPVLACLFLWANASPARMDAGIRRSAWGWVFLAIAAVHGIDGLHSRFAIKRASLDAVAYLTSQGIPRDRIMAGWEIDGWEQIERWGYINDSRIRVPADAFQRWQPDGYPENLFIRNKLPALTPEYIVTHHPARFPGDGTPFPRFPYTSWWPPFRREVVISHQTPTHENESR